MSAASQDTRAGAVSVPLARVALVASLGAYLALGPFVVQVLGVDTDALPRWTMFNTHVSRMCLVDYREVTSGGSRPVNRYAWLGIPDPGLAPPDVALIRSADEAWSIGRRLCRERPGAELRVSASCARDGAWQPVLLGDTDVCAAGARR